MLIIIHGGVGDQHQAVMKIEDPTSTCWKCRLLSYPFLVFLIRSIHSIVFLLARHRHTDYWETPTNNLLKLWCLFILFVHHHGPDIAVLFRLYSLETSSAGSFRAGFTSKLMYYKV